MMDDAELIKELRATGKRFFRLEQMLKERGYRIELHRHYGRLVSGGADETEIKILKEVEP